MKINTYLLNLIIMPCFFSWAANAEVIQMQNGDIYLGKAIIANPENIEIQTFGKKLNVFQKDIHAILQQNSFEEKNYVEVILSDDSILRGKIKDYDDEVGIFLKASFGEITIPAAGVKQIINPVQGNIYYGERFMFSASGGYYFPFTDLKDNFDANYITGLTFEFNLRKVRGIALGAHALFLPMEYSPSDEVIYRSYGILGRLAYRYGDLRFQTLPIINRMIPFVALELGGVYLTVHDERENAVIALRNEIVPTSFLLGGMDILLFYGFALRAEAGVMNFYESGLYSSFVCSGSIVYLFSL